jgi:hypothetical protein
MNRRNLAFALSLAPVAAVFGSWAANAAESLDWEARVRTGPFDAVPSVRDIPTEIFGLCYGPNARLAEPGAAFNPTDVEDARPHLRLVWAVTDRELYILHIEVGGRSHFFRTIVASVQGSGHSMLLWEGAGARIDRFEDFRSSIQSQR